MRKPLTVVTLAFLASIPAACKPPAGAAPVVELNGEYRATSKGPITKITFSGGSHYSMVKTVCSGGEPSCIETGTYSVPSTLDSVTFTDAVTHASNTMPFKATLKSAPTTQDSLASRGVGLTLEDNPITRDVGPLLVGLLIELIEDFMAGGQSFSDGAGDGGSGWGGDAGGADDAGEDAGADGGSGTLIPITVVPGTNGKLDHVTAQVSIGGSAPFTAIVDTGSTGLRVFGSVPDSAWSVTSTADKVTYGGDVNADGVIANAVVSIGGVSTGVPISVVKVTSISCTSSYPNCPASGKTPDMYELGGGAVAYLGIGFRATGIASPLAFMGNNQQHILRVPPVGQTVGNIEIDPSQDEIATFSLTQLTATGTTSATGVSSWDDTQVPYTLNGLQGTALFDTGANAFIDATTASQFMAIGVPDNSTSIPSGTMVKITIDQGSWWSFTVSASPVAGVDLFPLGTRPGNGRGDNMGLAAFREFDAFHDYAAGALGFTPKPALENQQ